MYFLKAIIILSILQFKHSYSQEYPTAHDLNYLEPFRNYACEVTTPGIGIAPSTWYSSNYGTDWAHDLMPMNNTGDSPKQPFKALSAILYDRQPIEFLIDISLVNAPYLEFKNHLKNSELCFEYLTKSRRVLSQCLTYSQYSVQVAKNSAKLMFLGPSYKPHPWLVIDDQVMVGIPPSKHNCENSATPNTPTHLHEVLRVTVAEDAIDIYSLAKDDRVLVARAVLTVEAPYAEIKSTYGSKLDDSCFGGSSKVVYSGWMNMHSFDIAKYKSLIFGPGDDELARLLKDTGLPLRKGTLADAKALWYYLLSEQRADLPELREFLVKAMFLGVPDAVRPHVWRLVSSHFDYFMPNSIKRQFYSMVNTMIEKGKLLEHVGYDYTKLPSHLEPKFLGWTRFRNFITDYDKDMIAYRARGLSNNLPDLDFDRLAAHHLYVSMAILYQYPEYGYMQEITPLSFALLIGMQDANNPALEAYWVLSKILNPKRDLPMFRKLSLSLDDVFQKNENMREILAAALDNLSPEKYSSIDDIIKPRMNSDIDHSLLVLVSMLALKYDSDVASLELSLQALDIFIARRVHKSTFS